MRHPNLVNAGFKIASHYDVMTQLDNDVHTNDALSREEADTALWLAGPHRPRSVFLPCVGTGRHIAPMLKAGVERIVGVDLSPASVAIAQEQFGNDPRVHLEVGDLTEWGTDEWFDATILLGNSFGDCVELAVNQRIIAGMLAPLKPSGVIVFDYIGIGYLPLCEEEHISEWRAVLNGKEVLDRRRPRYDAQTGIMAIDVMATPADEPDAKPLWSGTYLKLILSDKEVAKQFAIQQIQMTRMGEANQLVKYYLTQNHSDLGMLAKSTWWVGTKESDMGR